MFKKLVVSFGIVTLFCLSAFSIPATPQVHAASLMPNMSPALCSGTGCNGKDAYAERCAGYAGDSWYVVASAYIYDSYGSSVGYTQLWWSTTCQTNWARTVCTGSVHSSCAVAENWAYFYSADGQGCNKDVQDFCVRGGPDVRTMQLYEGSTKAEACGLITFGAIDTQEYCTGYY